MRYPPATMVSIGLPILAFALLGAVRVLNTYGYAPAWFQPGGGGAITLRIATGVLWVQLLVLLVAGRLIPPDWRAVHGRTVGGE